MAKTAERKGRICEGNREYSNILKSDPLTKDFNEFMWLAQDIDDLKEIQDKMRHIVELADYNTNPKYKEYDNGKGERMDEMVRVAKPLLDLNKRYDKEIADAITKINALKKRYWSFVMPIIEHDLKACKEQCGGKVGKWAKEYKQDSHHGDKVKGSFFMEIAVEDHTSYYDSDHELGIYSEDKTQDIESTYQLIRFHFGEMYWEFDENGIVKISEAKLKEIAKLISDYLGIKIADMWQSGHTLSFRTGQVNVEKRPWARKEQEMAERKIKAEKEAKELEERNKEYAKKKAEQDKADAEEEKKRQEEIANEQVFETKIMPSQQEGVDKGTIRVLFMFDEPLENRDKKYDEMTVMQYMIDGYNVEATWCDIPTALRHLDEVKSKIASSDTIVFDYGGISIAYGGIVDHWNFLFYKLIEDYASKYWYCQSHMDTFDEDRMKELESKGVVFLHSYCSAYKGMQVGFRESFMSEEGRTKAREWGK